MQGLRPTGRLVLARRRKGGDGDSLLPRIAQRVKGEGDWLSCCLTRPRQQGHHGSYTCATYLIKQLPQALALKLGQYLEQRLV